jgi:dipeptidyl aminopeptidase/acylaminoacyl peptidase
MTSERRFEHDLPDLLDQLSVGPMPDYRDDIVRRTAVTRQRPAWAFPERWIPMATFTARTAVVRQMPWRAMGLIALLVLTLLAAALIVGSQKPRQLPAPFGPAANGSVIYSAGGDIVSVDPVTKTAKAIVSGPELDFDPVWSRDGSRFAFMRQTADGIYVARSDGSDVRLVVPVSSGNLLPDGEILEYSFSPDGSELLVAIRCGQTLIGKTDGSGVRELVGVNTYGDARFRPDGKQIAFTQCGESGIGLVNADGTGLRDMAGPLGPYQYGAPSWSPDGSSLVYHRWDSTADAWTVRTRIIGADGAGDRALRVTPESDFDGLPAWSNDGKRLGVSLGVGKDIYAAILPVDGTGAIVRSSVPLVTELVCCTALEWAPDDSFVLVTPIDEQAQPGQQMLLDPLTGDIRPAPWTTTSPPSWQRLAP